MNWKIEFVDGKWRIVDKDGAPLTELSHETRDGAMTELKTFVDKAMEELAAADDIAPEAAGARFHMWFEEGEQTVDRRILDANSVNFNRPAPWPLMCMTENPEFGGHAGAFIAGVIDESSREGTTLHFYGNFDAGGEGGQEAERLVRDGVLSTWSPDIGDATVETEVTEEDEEGFPIDYLDHLIEGTFLGGTVCPMQAITSARIEIVGEGTATAETQDAPAEDVAAKAELTCTHFAAKGKIGVCKSCVSAASDQGITVADFVNRATETSSKTAGPSSSSASTAKSQSNGKDDAPGEGAPSATKPTRSGSEILATKGSKTTRSSGRGSEQTKIAGSVRTVASARPTQRTTGAQPASTSAGKKPTGSSSSKKAGALSASGRSASAPGEEQSKTPTSTTTTNKGRSEGGSALPATAPSELSETILASSDQHSTTSFVTVPPAAWFKDPELDGSTPLTVEKDGRVYGHLATFGQCHTGMQDRCVLAPRSIADYAYFLTGALETEEGDVVRVGQLTMGTGHADLSLRHAAAKAHYDGGPGAVQVADVAAGEDDYGIWIAGAMRPGLTSEQVREFRAHALSGDWRDIAGNMELVAALSVPVPGFPVTIAASGAKWTGPVKTRLRMERGRCNALVAAGMVRGPNRIDESSKVARLEALVDSQREDIVKLQKITKGLIASAS